MTPTRRLLLGLALALAAAWPSFADEAVITGTVVYRERMLLPEGATATVTLEDVSLADAPAPVLAEVTIPARTSPTPFTLPYPAISMADGHSYALRASISAGGALMFTTTEHVAFDGTRIDGIELLVRRTDGGTPAVVGTWIAEDIGGAGVIDDLQSTLTVAADGTVNGNGGCNGYGGKATIAGDKITFGPMVGTLMACAEAIMGQEKKLHDALARSAAFEIDAEGKLVLLDASRTELAKFIAG